jgi:hypothetical protein
VHPGHLHADARGDQPPHGGVKVKGSSLLRLHRH